MKDISNYEDCIIEDVDVKRVKVKGHWHSRTHFRLGWAQTIASTQGDIIEQDYAVWDVMHPYMSVKELITAIGRCRYASRVHIFTDKQTLDLGPLRGKATVRQGVRCRSRTA